MIANSKFNDYLTTLQPNAKPLISFTVTEDMLNDLLKNITLTAITAYGHWNTTTNVTIDSIVAVYSLSSPLSIILPYGLSLLFAFPCIILGLWALQKNGVAAIDGGFIQLISTSMGSAALEREALNGCLGGPENISSRLKNLKIRFGELKSGGSMDRHGDRGIRRAGFGTEDEILPLRKGARYGKLDD